MWRALWIMLLAVGTIGIGRFGYTTQKAETMREQPIVLPARPARDLGAAATWPHQIYDLLRSSRDARVQALLGKLQSGKAAVPAPRAASYREIARVVRTVIPADVIRTRLLGQGIPEPQASWTLAQIGPSGGIALEHGKHGVLYTSSGYLRAFPELEFLAHRNMPAYTAPAGFLNAPAIAIFPANSASATGYVDLSGVDMTWDVSVTIANYLAWDGQSVDAVTLTDDFGSVSYAGAPTLSPTGIGQINWGTGGNAYVETHAGDANSPFGYHFTCNYNPTPGTAAGGNIDFNSLAISYTICS